MSDNLHNAIRIHHALATKATDYTKKQHVFRLQTADQAEYLFQTSDSKELQSWVETINFVCAAYSAPPLEGGVGSQKRFQRPLLPCTHTKYLLKEQLESHEQQLEQLENMLSEHRKAPIPNKGLPLQNYKEKENYLQHELRRYKTYVSILSAKVLNEQQQQQQQQQQQKNEQQSQQQQQIITLNEESVVDTFPITTTTTTITQQQLQQTSLSQEQTTTNSIIITKKQQQQQQQQQQIISGTTSSSISSASTATTTANNRYSYRAAIYRAEVAAADAAIAANAVVQQQQQHQQQQQQQQDIG